MLCEPLRIICSTESSTEREEAVKSLWEIAAQMKEEDMANKFIPFLKKLAASKHTNGLDSLRDVEEHKLVVGFSEDKSNCVRIKVANQLNELGKLVGPEDMTHLVPGYVGLLHNPKAKKSLDLNEQMSHIIPQVSFGIVKNPGHQHWLSTLDIVFVLAPVIESEFTCSTLLPVVILASKDKLLDVRLVGVEVLQSLIQGVDNPEASKNTIQPCLVELGEDPDVEVKFFKEALKRAVL
ncbi:hypothetical protein Sjap_019815 [Stephania japonica]|uniref:Uncharacterized protein n=1 Tax=Stephania japonica TaxID=461633 RepID=A0AAP0EZH6_9MAGN